VNGPPAPAVQVTVVMANKQLLVPVLDTELNTSPVNPGLLKVCVTVVNGCVVAVTVSIPLTVKLAVKVEVPPW